jgi:hypothetical protein
MLVVTFNAEKVLEYHHDRPLTDKQQADLELLDNKLNAGFSINGQTISHPTELDKATFMANALTNALNLEDESKAALSCTYLATRFENLKQIRVVDKEGQASIQLIFDKDYVEEVPITFSPIKH